MPRPLLPTRQGQACNICPFHTVSFAVKHSEEMDPMRPCVHTSTLPSSFSRSAPAPLSRDHLLENGVYGAKLPPSRVLASAGTR